MQWITSLFTHGPVWEIDISSAYNGQLDFSPKTAGSEEAKEGTNNNETQCRTLKFVCGGGAGSIETMKKKNREEHLERDDEDTAVSTTAEVTCNTVGNFVEVDVKDRNCHSPLAPTTDSSTFFTLPSVSNAENVERIIIDVSCKGKINTIPDDWCAHMKKLVSVEGLEHLSGCIEVIGSRVFHNCNSLKGLDSTPLFNCPRLHTVGNDVLSNNNVLYTITNDEKGPQQEEGSSPDAVRTNVRIGDNFLSNNPRLYSATLSAVFTTRVRLAGHQFMSYNPSMVRVCTAGGATTSLSPYKNQGNALRLPALQVLGHNAFCSNTALTSLDLSSAAALGVVGHSFVFGNEALTIVRLPPNESHLAHVGDGFISNNRHLADVHFPTTITGNLTTIPNNFLAMNPVLKSVTLNAFAGVVNVVGDNCLQHCEALEAIDLSFLSTVTSIGDCFMHGCKKLNAPLDVSKSGEHITTVGGYFLADCVALSEATGLSALTSLRHIGCQFLSNTSIPSIDLSDLPSLEKVGSDFCSECSALQSVKISGVPRLRHIGERFLSQLPALECVEVHHNVSLAVIGSCFLCGNNSLRSADVGGILADVERVPDYFLCGNPLLEEVHPAAMKCVTTHVGHEFVSNNASLKTFSIHGFERVEMIGDGFLAENGALERLVGCSSVRKHLSLIGSRFLAGNPLLEGPLSFRRAVNLSSIGDEFLSGCNADLLREITLFRNMVLFNPERSSFFHQLSASETLRSVVAAKSFVVLRLLGSGSFGNVLHIVDNEEKHFALKVAKDDKASKEMLAAERTIHKKLKHTNIVKTYESPDVSKEYPHSILLEYHSEGSLWQLLNNPGRRSRLTLGQLRKWGRDVLLALQYLHNELKPGGIVVHHDISPKNILLGADGTLYLCDLGFASHPSESGRSTVRDGHGGTRPYLPPEQTNAFGNLSYHRTSDIWSVAVIFLELATGQKPYSVMPHQVPFTGEQLKTTILPTEVVQELKKCLNPHYKRRPTASKLLELQFFRRADDDDQRLLQPCTQLAPTPKQSHARNSTSTGGSSTSFHDAHDDTQPHVPSGRRRSTPSISDMPPDTLFSRQVTSVDYDASTMTNE